MDCVGLKEYETREVSTREVLKEKRLKMEANDGHCFLHRVTLHGQLKTDEYWKVEKSFTAENTERADWRN